MRMHQLCDEGDIICRIERSKCMTEMSNAWMKVHQIAHYKQCVSCTQLPCIHLLIRSRLLGRRRHYTTESCMVLAPGSPHEKSPHQQSGQWLTSLDSSSWYKCPLPRLRTGIFVRTRQLAVLTGNCPLMECHKHLECTLQSLHSV